MQAHGYQKKKVQVLSLASGGHGRQDRKADLGTPSLAPGAGPAVGAAGCRHERRPSLTGRFHPDHGPGVDDGRPDTPVGTTYTTEGNSQHPEAEQEAHQLKLESAPGGEKLGQRGDLPAVPGVAAVSGFHKEKSVGALPTGPRRASQLGSTQAKARERAQAV